MSAERRKSPKEKHEIVRKKQKSQRTKLVGVV